MHFGQNYWNIATYAGNLRMLIKSLAEQQGINIEKMDKELKDDKIVWWILKGNVSRSHSFKFCVKYTLVPHP